MSSMMFGLLFDFVKIIYFHKLLEFVLKVPVMDTTTALYKLNFATLDFECLEHGRFTYNVKKDFVGFLALKFGLVYIYLFSCHDFIVCGSCLGEGFLI
jgi:hypothetical protein